MIGNRDLDGALRSLDAAGPPRSAGSARALADLESILAIDPVAGPRSARGRVDRRRRVTRGRIALAGGALAALTAGALALPSVSGGDAAFASWTADPTALSAQEAADAAQSCRRSQQGGPAGFAAQLQDAFPAIAERRGVWTTVVLAGSEGFRALCITDDSSALLDRGMIGSIGAPPDWAPPGPRALRARDLGRGTMSAGDLSLAAGDAGSDVAGVLYRSPVHGDVIATLAQGQFAFWLPGDELEHASSAGVEVQVTYRDGSTGTTRLSL
jgi:hypothetical protein